MPKGHAGSCSYYNSRYSEEQRKRRVEGHAFTFRDSLEEALRHTDPTNTRVKEAWDLHKADMTEFRADWNFETRARSLLALYLVWYRPSKGGGDEDGPPPKEYKKDSDPDGDQGDPWKEYGTGTFMCGSRTSRKKSLNGSGQARQPG